MLSDICFSGLNVAHQYCFKARTICYTSLIFIQQNSSSYSPAHLSSHNCFHLNKHVQLFACFANLILVILWGDSSTFTFLTRIWSSVDSNYSPEWNEFIFHEAINVPEHLLLSWFEPKNTFPHYFSACFSPRIVTETSTGWISNSFSKYGSRSVVKDKKRLI